MQGRKERKRNKCRGYNLGFHDTMRLFIKNDVVLDAPERNIRTEVGCLCLAAMFFFPKMLFSGLNAHSDKIVATPAKKCAPTGSVSTLDTPAPADTHPKTKAALGATNTQSGRR